jgi:hypothetical protein
MHATTKKSVSFMDRRTAIPLTLVVAIASVVVGCSDVASEVVSVESSGHRYMDIHRNVDGLTADAIADAHQLDVETQGKYGVNYERYWYDEDSGTVFCLVDAPSKELASRVHKEAHGLVADEIIEVSEGS